VEVVGLCVVVVVNIYTVSSIFQCWFSSFCDFWNSAIEIKSLTQYDLENLLYINGMRSRSKDLRCFHCFRKFSFLFFYFFLFFSRKVCKIIIFGSNEKRNCSLIKSSRLSVPFFNTI